MSRALVCLRAAVRKHSRPDPTYLWVCMLHVLCPSLQVAGWVRAAVIGAANNLKVLTGHKCARTQLHSNWLSRLSEPAAHPRTARSPSSQIGPVLLHILNSHVSLPVPVFVVRMGETDFSPCLSPLLVPSHLQTIQFCIFLSNCGFVGPMSAANNLPVP